MSKIIFVNPSLDGEDKGDFKIKKKVVVPPQGLCCLAAVTKKNKFETIIIDAPALGLNHRQTLEIIRNESPRYVGITAATVMVHAAAELARMIKEENREIVTIIGGSHLTVLPRQTMELFPYFDIGVIGEGERTIVELLKALEAKKSLKDVKGLIVRKGNKFKVTGRRPFIKNLDSLPLPAWDLLPDLAQHYQQSVARADELPAASLVTSRGCPGKCIFCGRQVFGNTCRSYSAERVMEMIDYLTEHYGIKSIVINDDNFVFFRKRLRELCRMLSSRSNKLNWSCFSRVDNVNSEILGLMKKAGCSSIAYGIESGSQKILDMAGKGISLKQVEEAVGWTKKAGIRTTGYFIIGFPGETRKTIRETIRFAKSLPLDDFLLSYMVAYPGSKLYETAYDHGWFDDNWENMNQWKINFVPQGLTGAELEYYFNKGMRAFYFRPRIILSHLRRALKSEYIGQYFKEGLTVFKFLLKR